MKDITDQFFQEEIKRAKRNCIIAAIFFAIVILFVGCKKEHKPIVKGGTYRVQSNVFNTGVWQPLDTLYANSIYFNNAAGLWYCQCLGPANGITPIMGQGAKIDSLNGTVEWFI